MRRLVAICLLLMITDGCGALPNDRLPSMSGTSVRMETADERRAAFAQAYALYRRGDGQGALPIFAALVTAYPELADYHLFFAGAAAVRAGRDTDAERWLGRLLDRYPRSVHVAAAELELGQLLVRRGRLDAGRVHLSGALNAATDQDTAHTARLALADAEERAGNADAAYRGFMAVRQEMPNTPLGRLATEHVRALRSAHPEYEPSGVERLPEARLLLREHDFPGAETLAAAIVLQPGVSDPAEALRVQAEALSGQGKAEAALKTLWDVADRYPSSEEAPPALYRMATILWNRDRDVAALRAFEDLLGRYPTSAKAAEALYAVGRIHQQAGRDAAAIETYSELAKRYPRSKAASDAGWRIGWIHYRAGQWGAAATAFSTMGRGSQAATYWEARALEYDRRPAAARQLYHQIMTEDPDGYYALWAEQRLRGTLPARLILAAAVPAPPPRVAVDPAGLGDSFHIERWHELEQMRMFGWARKELAAIEHDGSHDPATLQFLLRAYQLVDGHTAAARVARRLGGAGLSASELEQLSYPLAFWDIVRPRAETQTVDPLLVVSIMRQESMFDPTARSPADARGLMQLLPSTAQRMRAAAADATDVPDLNDPEINIDLGVRYLRTLHDHFGGDPLKVIAAYNGGEAAVEKWQQHAADLDPDEFVESISYRETRDYVKKVIANYRRYQRLYTGS